MIFSGFTNFPSIIIPKVSQRPLSPTSLRLQGGFFLRGVLPRRAAVQHGRSAHSPRAGASCAEKDKKGSNRFAGQGVRDEKPDIR